ncbi:MAG: glycosyltransferase, partial [Planctomycetota bacterium]|nr:glycosyltransferase [Planctomycetota bacterium]
MDVSIVIPIYNETENLDLLYGELTTVIDQELKQYEIILVDDGSSDGTTEKIKLLAAEDTRIKPVLLRRNFGQTAAMKAGIDFATAPIIVTMDGDLQNDP